MTIIQVLSLVFIVISLLNILVAFIQFYTDRNSVHKTIIFYWVGSLISAFVNGLFPENDMRIISVSIVGTFISTYFLGRFFAQLHDVKISFKKIFTWLLISYILTFILSRSNLNFSLYAIPSLLGCIAPLPIHLIAVYRKKVNLTITQKIFFVTATIMTIHYLDWAYVRERPELFLSAFLIALLILFMLSILTPMLANEYSLMKRNNELEEEVTRKALQLTEVESNLWKANKLASLGRMAAGVAHEMNTPLAAIRITAESIVSNLEPNKFNIAKSQAWANKITTIVDKLSDITSQLRIYGSNYQTDTISDISADELIEQAILPFKNKLTHSGINFSVTLNDNNAQIKAQKSSIVEVITHLLRNAIKACENVTNPWIQIETKLVDNFLHIYVKDNGLGIPNHIRGQIFDPFFTTHDVGIGKGLGLSMSQVILNQHKGEVSLISSKPEENETTFLIKIPLT